MLRQQLETQRLVLRQIARGDALAIFASYAQDSEVVRYLTWRPHRRLTDTEAYIGRCLGVPPQRARTYALVGRAEGRVIGAFDLRRPEPHRHDCGYVLARPFWGRGLMTEALGGPVGDVGARHLADRSAVRRWQSGLGPGHGKSRVRPRRHPAPLARSPQHFRQAPRLLQLRADPIAPAPV